MHRITIILALALAACTPRLVKIDPARPPENPLPRWNNLRNEGKLTAEEFEDLVGGRAVLADEYPLRGAQRRAIERAVGPL